MRARVRFVAPLAPGMVASFFGYSTRAGIRDEIDFELLTNDAVAGVPRILTNVFDDEPFSSAGAFQFVAGPNPWTFHDLEIDWLPDRIRWLIDGVLVREELARVPDEPLNVRLNLWAPDFNFSAAYSPELRPVSNQAQNRTFFYEIDFVDIRRAP